MPLSPCKGVMVLPNLWRETGHFILSQCRGNAQESTGYWLTVSSMTHVKDTFFWLQKHKVCWRLWARNKDRGVHVGRTLPLQCPRKETKLQNFPL